MKDTIIRRFQELIMASVVTGKILIKIPKKRKEEIDKENEDIVKTKTPVVNTILTSLDSAQLAKQTAPKRKTRFNTRYSSIKIWLSFKSHKVHANIPKLS